VTAVRASEVLAKLAPAGWIVADVVQGRWTSGFLREIEVPAAEVAALHREGWLSPVDLRSGDRLLLRIDPDAAQRAVRNLGQPPAQYRSDWHVELSARPMAGRDGWGEGEVEPFRVLIGFKRTTFERFLDHLVAIEVAVRAADTEGAALVGGTFRRTANLVARHALPASRAGVSPALHGFEEGSARFRYLPKRGVVQVRLGTPPGPSVICEPLTLSELAKSSPQGDRSAVGSQVRRMKRLFDELRAAMEVPEPEVESGSDAG
jgi:hypothetical protein